MAGVLLITGATGIADATASLARKQGYGVFLVGLEATSDFSGDLREEAVSKQAVRMCLERHGRIDGLFNVAGISGRRFGDGPLHECSAEGWDVTMGTNVRTLFLMSRAVLRHWMSEHRQGAILNMASVLAFSPEPRHFASHAYTASKGAILSLTRAMASYYAPHGIRVNAIAPGLVRTPMSARAQKDEEILEFIRLKQPLSGGMLDADDVAEAALFLLSERSRHITGSVLTVDGGWSLS
jgi:NAD(P)-dependent dehydrogenase (short-subunit alcohol dehydrogenase family)